ncbi:hypothetical protein [Haloarchaeobius sp. DT45]|uniref:hypothetical protein n=1 Tax=Haloarchaeobius sp. DT45 TaxID=3446116 RepID=UPI003F6C5AF5
MTTRRRLLSTAGLAASSVAGCLRLQDASEEETVTDTRQPNTSAKTETATTRHRPTDTQVVHEVEGRNISWRPSTEGDAEIALGADEVKFICPGCSGATVTSDLGDIETLSVAFTYWVSTEEWDHLPFFEVAVDGDVSYRATSRPGVEDGFGDEAAFDVSEVTVEAPLERTFEPDGKTAIRLGLVPREGCQANPDFRYQFIAHDIVVRYG